MAYVIAEPCIGTKDAACVDACPVDCIHPKKDEAGFAETDQLFIDPVECIDCGACVPVCPVSAIYAADDLPEKWADYQAKNAAHLRAVEEGSRFSVVRKNRRAVPRFRAARFCFGRTDGERQRRRY